MIQNVTWWILCTSAASMLLLYSLQSSASPNVREDDPGDRLQHAMKLKDEFRDREALQAFTSVLDLQSDHFTALWYTAMLHVTIGHREGEGSVRDSHYEQAYELALKLLKHHPDSAGSHFVYAAVTGRKAQNASARERIRMSPVIREHAEKAVELDPEYARAWNVLGVWHHRAANLSRLERFAANALFGGAPEGADNDKARKAFERAIELEPDFIVFYHDKASFYRTIGEKEKARETIRTALSLKETTSDDVRWKRNMQQMLTEL